MPNDTKARRPFDGLKDNYMELVQENLERQKLSQSFKDLLKTLLDRNPKTRLCSLKALQRQRWFKNLGWNASSWVRLKSGAMKSPLAVSPKKPTSPPFDSGGRRRRRQAICV